MRRYILLCVIILLALCGKEVLSQPKLEFENGDSYDFGEVLMENAPYFVKIKIRNTGTEDLKIFDIEKDCGCTWAPIDKNIIPPGDFAIVEIRQTFPVTGNASKVLTFHTNDPDKPRAQFYLYAKVSTLSAVGNILMDFGEIKLNEVGKSSISIKNEKDFPVRIIKIKNSSKSITLNINDGAVIPPKSQLKVEATFHPQSAGQFSEPIYLLTNDKDMGKITIHTNCKVIATTISN